LIDSRLGNESPSLSRVADTLVLIDRAINSLLSKQQERTNPLARPPLEPAMEAEPAETADTVPAETAGPEVKEAFEPNDLRLATGPIRSRADAYRQLEGIANFLQSIEPHSPTPYLVRRAVSWGRMPLPELMQEVLREEGDLNRLFKVLGLKQDKA
jgi:type VI secretion system protein ImpA